MGKAGKVHLDYNSSSNSISISSPITSSNTPSTISINSLPANSTTTPIFKTAKTLLQEINMWEVEEDIELSQRISVCVIRPKISSLIDEGGMLYCDYMSFKTFGSTTSWCSFPTFAIFVTVSGVVLVTLIF
ncbi:9679_t:CDS:2 [Entrophospora sp. SA101]|nr:9679_t:CDS:2 [Entrophospora sp. SA101]